MSNPFFCWHKWAKWSAPKQVTKVCWERDQSYERRITIQDRACDVCGKYQTRVVTVVDE